MENSSNNKMRGRWRSEWGGQVDSFPVVSAINASFFASFVVAADFVSISLINKKVVVQIHKGI